MVLENGTLVCGILVIDDRIHASKRANSALEVVLAAYRNYPSLTHEKSYVQNLEVAHTAICPEDGAQVRREISKAFEKSRFLLTIGGTGLRPNSVTPEVSREFIRYELAAISTQILLTGLNSTDKAGLGRGIVGTTANRQLIVNAPGSSGGVKDTLQVVLPLLSSIFNQLDELD